MQDGCGQFLYVVHEAAVAVDRYDRLARVRHLDAERRCEAITQRSLVAGGDERARTIDRVGQVRHVADLCDLVDEDAIVGQLVANGVQKIVLRAQFGKAFVEFFFERAQFRLTRGARVRVETLGEPDSLAVEADGDVRGRTPAEFRVMAAALRVVAAP